MQLTKDDVIKTEYGALLLDYPKFLQVVEFYNRYKVSRLDFMTDYPKVYKRYIFEVGRNQISDMIKYRDWLFNYCFKDGLK